MNRKASMAKIWASTAALHLLVDTMAEAQFVTRIATYITSMLAALH